MKNYLLFIFLAVLLCFTMLYQKPESQVTVETKAVAETEVKGIEKVEADAEVNVTVNTEIVSEANDDNNAEADTKTVPDTEVKEGVNKFRVMVLSEERIDDKEPFIPTTEGVILGVFEKAGYLIVDPGKTRDLLNAEQDELMDAARALSADAIVYCKAYGSVITRQRINNVNLLSVRSTVQLKTQLVKSTDYLVTQEIVEKKAIGFSAEDGAIKGFKEAAQEAAENVASKLAIELAKKPKAEDKKIAQEPAISEERAIAVLVNGESEHHNATVAALVCRHLDEKGRKLVNEKGLAAFRKASLELLPGDNEVINSVGAIISIRVHAEGWLNEFGLYTGSASIALIVSTPEGKITFADVVQGKQLGGSHDEAAQKAVEAAALRAVEKIILH